MGIWTMDIFASKVMMILLYFPSIFDTFEDL